MINFLLKPLSIFVLGLLTSVSVFSQTLPTATETAKAITIGWNLGNTLEAIGGETAWGNPLTTQSLIDSVRAAGFNTIRVPVSWHTHADPTTNTIDTAWLARVKEVVDYGIKNNMYIILNIHWDNGWLENNVTEAMQASVNEKQFKYWTQIANYFKSYDGHLLFASANEPNVENGTQMAVLVSYHQTFIKAVRATGGNNSSRTLIVQGPSTDIEKTKQWMNTLPTDEIADRLMVEVHYYTPYNFTLMTEDTSWGKMFYYWGKGYHSTSDVTRNATYGEETAVDALFQSMKTKFIDKGIPVIIGEFAAIKRTSLTREALALHTASRQYYLNYVASAAVRFGDLKLIYWDNGYYGNNNTGLFDRSTGAIMDRGAVAALMEGTGKGVVTGIADNEEITDTQIFPNPFTSTINLLIAKPNQVNRIVILDMVGKQLETIEKAGISSISTIGSSLKPGLYLVQIQGADSYQSFKVLKK